MDYVEYANNWAKSEVAQGRIMIAFGVGIVVLLILIFKGQNELLKGMLIPLSLLATILIGYGAFILYDRPAHAQKNIELYQDYPEEAIVQERAKHINDNKAGDTLMN